MFQKKNMVADRLASFALILDSPSISVTLSLFEDGSSVSRPRIGPLSFCLETLMHFLLVCFSVHTYVHMFTNDKACSMVKS